jgi:glycosyltransferase involved in cell wall biosynthesis
VIFIADHIKKLLLNDVDLPSKGVRVHTIQCGVDMDRYPMSHNIDPHKVAWVARQWRSKGTDYALQILAKLPEQYKIYSLGEFGDYEWEKKYMENFLRANHLEDRWIQETHVDDISRWYEDKGVLLSCSHKEGFGYTIGEGMARGLKPVVHRFYGAEDIWEPYLWDTIDDAVAQITTIPDNREQYRQYLIDRGYTLENMINRIEKEVING